MERNQKIIIGGIAFIIAITFLGFFESYFARFPGFDNIAMVTHIHVIAFILWMAILIGQPFLIKQNKLISHRQIGKFTFILTPVLFVTILLMAYHQLSFYVLGQSNEFIRNNMLGGLISGTTFIVCYIIAMINVKNLRWHVAFIIGSSLVLLIPGLGRFVDNMVDGSFGLLSMIIVPYLVLIFILSYEKVKLKRNIINSPYALIFVIQVIGMVLFLTISPSESWGSFVKQLAEKY